MRELTNKELFDTDKTIAKQLIDQFEYPWQVLSSIRDFITQLGNTLSSDEYYSPKENVWISKSATVAENATILAPTIICEDAEIRHCAFIRGCAIVGRGAVVGNSSELKNCILFDRAQIPHFNYVGDSIVGYKSHLGAGSITSNLKSDGSNVTILYKDKRVQTGLRKFGAAVGDLVEVGCSSVLNPGTVIGKHTNVYPLSSVRGFVNSESIFKEKGNIVQKN